MTSTRPAGNDDGRAIPTGRAAVVNALRRSPVPATVPDLADRLGLHPNTVRFHLLKLVQTGLAVEERAAPDGPGRPRLTYRLVDTTPREESVAEYQVLVEILAGYLATRADDPAAAARAAGREWGRRLVAVAADHPAPGVIADLITRMLDELGFAPEQQGGDILLHRCPFRTAAEHQPGVICSVHLGLIQGAMDELGVDGDRATLDPLVTPGLCVAHLPTGDASPG